MKINSFLKNMLRRTALVSALPLATGCFLPALYAEDTVVTYEYTAENWPAPAPDSIEYEQPAGEPHPVSVSGVNSPGTQVVGGWTSGTARGANGNTVIVSDSKLGTVIGGRHNYWDFAS